MWKVVSFGESSHYITKGSQSSQIVVVCSVSMANSIASLLNYSDSVIVNLLTKEPPAKAEERATSHNSPSAEICPHLDTWTVLDKDNRVKYKIPACTCSGQKSHLA